jgi:hypothetical protein
MRPSTSVGTRKMFWDLGIYRSLGTFGDHV